MCFSKSRAIGLASMLFVLVWSGSAHAAGAGQYLLTGGSGGQAQLGTGLPLPIGSAGIFLGGMTPTNGGTSCGMGAGGCTISPDGPGTAYWPPLLVPPNPRVSTGGAGTVPVVQTGATPRGGAIQFPPRVLRKTAPGVPAVVAVFPTNPAVMQVATSLDWAWPAANETLAPGGAPGPAVFPGPGGGLVTYSGGVKSFGGPGQFAVAPGPGAGAGRVPPNGAGVLPVVTGWINFAGGAPSTVMTLGIVGASNPGGLAQPGAPVTAPGMMTAFGPVLNAAATAPNGIGVVNIPTGGVGCTMFCVGPSGTVPSSLQPGGGFPSNMVTSSKGFPWTTGLLTVSQPGAVPPEIFFLSGTDMRVAGVGNVSLVSGALSARALSGPNANRGWLSLTFPAAIVVPEPTVALGAAGALAMLALCHGLVRRRSRWE